MYRYFVNKRKPLSHWLLDDTVPFQEYTGFGATGGTKSGSGAPTTSVALVSGAAFSSVFGPTKVGQFAQNVFKVGMERRPFALEAWCLPIPKTSTGDQQILSHGTIFDGLSINGKVIRFGTSYATAGNAFCTYDLIVGKLAHCVGVHTADQNQLWVNGELVASVDITDAQKADSYVAAADGFLNAGYTLSTQEIAMNGVAIYTSLSGDQITQNWLAGNDVIGQHRVYPQYSGLPFDLDANDGSIYIDKTWADSDDFAEGLKSTVEYAPDYISPSYTAGVSIAGTWTVAVPLDSQGDTSIYGVMLEWSSNNATVAWSLDGTTWTTAVNGELISGITSGYNPTGKDLQVRVSFAGGVTMPDPAYLESLHLVAFRNNTIVPTAARTVTISGAAVPRGDFEPTYMRDDNGVNLHNGTLTIGTDTTADPEVARTLEIWMKVLSGTPTISVTGTKYRNGVADSTQPIGEWSVYHIVAAADITSAITITGDCIVGQVTLYPTALTASDVAFIENSYSGATAIRFTETQNTLAITEGATPATVYAHDWAIDGGG